MRKLALPLALVFGFAMVGCSDDDDDCVDVDGDGYGEGSGCRGADCDDNDVSIWESMTLYGDVDGDGEPAAASTNVCTDGMVPTGYSETAGTDCDDTDADAVMLVTAYADDDGDGYGFGAAIDDVCGDTDYLPPGYADNADDCDDASAVLFASVTGYADLDGDGEPVAVEETFCATTMTPDWLGTVAGTDCDDFDPWATSDASTPTMCSYQGKCLDTEFLSAGLSDMAGIGSCAAADCNGADPTCAEPMIMGIECTDVGDCSGSEICHDFNGDGTAHCWDRPNCCTVPTIGYTCAQLTGCLQACYEIEDDAAALECLQIDCFEEATPEAQMYYSIAQECAAAAGCFTQSDFTTCAATECLNEFVLGCMAN